jgi:WD40 repeat protein/tRNA A-37 threonylcarbamoyl transferase component Bud32
LGISVRNCPPQEELLAFHLGTLPEIAVDALAEHLEECSDCSATLQRFEESDDPFFEALRHPSPEIYSDSTRIPDGHAEDEADTAFVVEVLSLPGYDILDTLGRGGMGVVYKARQQRLNRAVALKQLVCKQQRDLARARREAESLARLQHPNIVQIFEIVEHEGRIYLALELVEGGTLSARLRGKPQPAEASAQLVETLARAIHSAHLRGIVHRDLKPSNVLLAKSEAVSSGPASAWSGFSPKITDFGIAKQLSFASGDTREGDVIGTPGYMAPEQAGGEAVQVGPAADVYSLGVLLYELLTGRVPLLDANVVETLLRVRNEEPMPPRRLAPRLPRDLEIICLKCLRKEPGQRYASAEALADDLHRFLSHQPIRARPTPMRDRLRKWVERHPGIAALTALVVLTAVLGFFLVAWQWRRAEDKAALAQDREEREKEARLQVQGLVAGNALSEGVNLCENGETAHGLLWMVRALEIAEAVGEGDSARAARCNLAAWQPFLTRHQADLPHGSWVWAVAFSPDGGTLATGSYDRSVRLWNAEGKPRSKPLEHRFPVWRIAFSPDGKNLLTASGIPPKAGPGGEARLWDVSSGRLLASWTHPSRVGIAVFNPVMPTCVTFSAEEAVIRSLRDGKTIGKPLKHSSPSQHSSNQIKTGGLSPDGKQVVTAGEDRTVRFWDAATGEPQGKTLYTAAPVQRVAFSPDGRTLLTGAIDGTVQMWDVATGKPRSPALANQGPVYAAAFSPDGTIAATASAIHRKDSRTQEDMSLGGEVRLWRVPTGESLGPPWQHPGEVWSLAFSPKGRRLLTGCMDGKARLFLIATGEQMATLPTASSGNVTQVAFNPSGTSCLIADTGGGVPVSGRIWQVMPEDSLPRVLLHNISVTALKFSPDSRLLLSGGKDHLAQLWDVATGKPQGSPLPHKYDVVEAAFSQDGRSLFTVCRVTDLSKPQLSDAALWDLKAGRQRPDMHPPRVTSAAFCDQGRTLLLADTEGNLQLHDAATGKPIGPPLKPSCPAHSLEFSRDERTLLMGTAGGAVLWDWKARRQRKKLSSGPGGAVAYFYPDESGLLLVQKGFGQVWDRDGTAPTAPPRFHAAGGISDLAFHPDSRSVLIRDNESRARLWDVPTGKRIGPAPGPTGIARVAFSPNGRRLAVAGQFGRVALWETSQPMQGSSERLRLWAETLAGMELDSQQIIHPLDPDEVRRRRARLDELGGPPADGF